MATKLYSMAEVAEHKDNKKTWIVIHNGVYDVTEFLNEVSFGRGLNSEKPKGGARNLSMS